MALTTGSRLGPYEVIARVGAGGMGEVYRGRDMRLNRTVAIKILPRELSHDAEFRKRFDREARALSSLTHPHICTVFDVGHTEGTDFLVMEYLEGETLSDRLARGPLPLDQLIRFAKDIAAALEAAHREGIIHRDLKPANVMLTKSGAKLFDFGLAKWAATQIFLPRAGRPQDETFDQKHPVTVDGSILGTIHYMAPEQLQGKPADSRADIFAFGALLYEMATGRRAFDGDSTASVIAAILEREPPPAPRESVGPPLLDHVVRACLRKDPEKRLQSAHDVSVALDWIAEGVSTTGAVAAVPSRRSWLPLVAALIFLATTITLAVMLLRLRESAPLFVSIPPPPETTFRFWGDNAGPAVVSPNGRLIAFVAAEGRGTALWVRPMGEARAAKLPSTESAMFPFWSPDSRSIAFFAGEKLKRIEVAGGPPLDLAPAPGGRGGAWSKRGVIVYAPSYDGGLVMVPASGGQPRPVTVVDRKAHTTHRWPVFVDDDRFVYLAANHDRDRADQTSLVLGDLDSKESRRLMAAESQADVWNGHLLFVRGGTLFAQRLDGGPRDLPRPLAENVFADNTTWRAAFSVSKNGVLAYHSAGSEIGTQLTWVDRSGTVLGKVGERALIDNVRISPDGKQVAVDIGDVIRNVWIFDLASGMRRRLTYTAGMDMIPVWSPDASRLVFSSSRELGPFDIYVTNANGAGGETRLITSNERKVASDWSRDGKYLVFNHREPSSDLYVLPLDTRKPRPFVETPADEYSAQFSPDGRWIAYNSHETGRGEIFITAFPNPGAKWQISTGGGRVARWRGDGGELFYLTPDNHLMAVELRMSGSAPEIVSTKSLFVAGVKGDGLSYDVARDGQRFLINSAGDEGARPLNVIVNLDVQRR